MDRDSVAWKGYIPALTTPFDAAGELEWDGWAELIEWVVSEGVHGIVVAGSSGEWFSMTGEERIGLFAAAVKQVRGRIPVLGCCNALRPAESVAFASAAHELRLDGIICAPPPYAVPNDRELFAFYERLSATVPLPLALYNWPRGTNVDMSRDLIERLASLDTVVAIKNSTRSFADFVQTFFAVKDRIRYFGFGTDELSVTLIRHHGGDGTIGGGAVLGREHALFYESIWSDELETARRYGERDAAFFRFSMNADFSPTFASAQAIYKAALNIRGLPGGFPRLPYLPLTEDETDRVREFLVSLDMIAPVPTG